MLVKEKRVNGTTDKQKKRDLQKRYIGGHLNGKEKEKAKKDSII